MKRSFKALLVLLMVTTALSQSFQVKAEENKIVEDEVVDISEESIVDEKEEVKEEDTTSDDVLIEIEPIVEVDPIGETDFYAVPEFVAPSTWEDITDLDKRTTIHNTFTRNGFDFEVVFDSKSVSFRTMLAEGKINNLTNGETYTYKFSRGSGSTSYLYFALPGESEYSNVYSNKVKVYKSISEAGKTESLIKVADYREGFRTIEEISVSKTGSIKTNLRIENISDLPIVDLKALATIDTELNGNDRIPLYANGEGGIYMSDPNITLTSKAGSDITNMYAGKFTFGTHVVEELSNPEKFVNTAGKANRELLVDKIDTCLFFQKNVKTLNPGDSDTMSFEVSVYDIEEDILAEKSKVTVHHILEDGTKLIDDELIDGNVGESYVTSPKANMSVYEVVQILGAPNGTFVTGSSEVTYIYREIKYGKITFNLVDEAGELIVDPKSPDGLTTYVNSEIQSRRVGTPISHVAPALSGYKFKEVTSSSESIPTEYTLEDQTINFVYSKVELVPPKDDNIVVVDPKEDNKVVTGVVNESGVMVLAALASLALVIVSFAKSKKETN